jgi:hypothetical protein
MFRAWARERGKRPRVQAGRMVSTLLWRPHYRVSPKSSQAPFGRQLCPAIGKGGGGWSDQSWPWRSSGTAANTASGEPPGMRGALESGLALRRGA